MVFKLEKAQINFVVLKSLNSVKLKMKNILRFIYGEINYDSLTLLRTKRLQYHIERMRIIC